ncbi:MAG: hypothetical protein RLZZ81_1262 [Pseudomonadota bacterium]|jgi:hypothetical protein
MEKSSISLNKINLVDIKVPTNPQVAKIKACIKHFIS